MMNAKKTSDLGDAFSIAKTFDAIQFTENNRFMQNAYYSNPS